MASEFYRKTAALYEEFQKKQIHYLNAERNLSHGRSYVSGKNGPLQEYLFKVIQREKETEENHKLIMKQMDELDKRVELVSLNLERLSTLYSDSSLAKTVAEPLYRSSNYTLDSLNEYYVNSVQSNRSSQILQSNSTQTENVFICDNCNSPISMNGIRNVNPENQASTSHRRELQQYPNLYSHVDEHVISEPDQLLSSGEILIKDSERSHTETIHDTSQLFSSGEIRVFNTSKNQTNVTASSDILLDRLQEAIANNTIRLENVHNESVESLSKGKSDDESMNHEFDFLEADRMSSPKHNFTSKNGLKSKDDGSIIEPNKNSSILADAGKNIISDKTVSADTRKASISSQKYFLQKQNDWKNEVKATTEYTENDDVKSDSIANDGVQSPSIHSGNISADTEDSYSEKNVPLSATAAYQALLGNAPVRTPEMEPLDESDSEDEIENAVLTDMRKASTESIESRPEVKKSAQEETSKSPAKSKSVPPNKPYKSLGKSTRKVLGLDTSSGSEMEPEINKAPATKDEDSDEFDFYD